jgi:integrase
VCEQAQQVLYQALSSDLLFTAAFNLWISHRTIEADGQRLAGVEYITGALQTTAGPNELRQLRLGDLVLEGREPYIQIPRAGAKNKYRKRAIPLITEDAVWAMEGLVARARELGAWSPVHYLFPLQRSRTHYDPNRPMSESGLKKPWDALRKDAAMPELRIYDLRHTGITRMAEAGVPLPVAMSFAGHMTPQMQRRYTAICMAAQRQWGAAVWGAGMAPPRPSSDETAQIRAAFDVPRKPVASSGIVEKGTVRRA